MVCIRYIIHTMNGRGRPVADENFRGHHQTMRLYGSRLPMRVLLLFSADRHFVARRRASTRRGPVPLLDLNSLLCHPGQLCGW